jgi:hypothetical protein
MEGWKGWSGVGWGEGRVEFVTRHHDSFKLKSVYVCMVCMCVRVRG